MLNICLSFPTPLGFHTQVVMGRETCTFIGDGRTAEAALNIFLIPMSTPPPCPFKPQVVVGKETCTFVGDGRTAEAVATRIKQIQNLIANTEQEFEVEKLSERMARLSGGVAIIQVGWGGGGREIDMEQEFEVEQLSERMARLSGCVAIIQVGGRGRGG